MVANRLGDRACIRCGLLSEQWKTSTGNEGNTGNAKSGVNNDSNVGEGEEGMI